MTNTIRKPIQNSKPLAAGPVCLVVGVAASIIVIKSAQLVYPFTAGFFSIYHISWEKLAYLLCLIIVPIVVYLTYKISLKKVYKQSLGLMAIIGVGIVSYIGTLDWRFFYLWAPDQLMTYLSPKTYALALLLLGVCWTGRKWWHSRGLVLGLMAGVAGYMANFVIINDIHRYNASALNLSVVMHSVVQVFFGKAVLINQKSQYGLYAHFIEPVFHLIGGVSVFNFSLVMAALVFVSILSVGLFLWLTLKNKWIALVGFLATLYFNYFLGQMWPQELYLQYFPLRTIFPTLLLPLYYWYQVRPNKIKYWFLWIVFAGGILWNLDVGIFCYLALFATLCYRVLDKKIKLREKMREIIALAVHGLIVLIGVFETFFVYEYWRYGEWPQFSELYSAHRLFVQATIVRLDSPWTIIALLYLMGMIFAVGKLIRHEKPKDGELAVLLTVLGSGIFTYYLNNPHDQVLTLCGYPAVILLAFLVDQAFRERRVWLPAWVGLGILCFLASSFVQNLRYSQLVGDTTTIEDLIAPNLNSAKSMWTIQKGCITCVDFVYENDYARDRSIKPTWVKKAEYTAAYTPNNGTIREDLLILSNWDYLLYLYGHAKAPLKMVNFHHLYLENEWNDLSTQITERRSQYIILDEDELIAIGAEKSHPREKIENLWQVIRANYHQTRREVVGDEYYDWQWHPNFLSTWERNVNSY